MSDFKCIATLPRDLRTGPHDPLPPVHTIGGKLIAAFPYPSLMTNQTTNMLIEFGKCTQGVVYNVVNWGSKLLRACPDDSKHQIDKVIKDGSRISFVFDGPFQISSSNTVDFWGTSYNVVGNVIKEGSIAVLRGFNTTSACSSSNLRSDLFPGSAMVVQGAGIASEWRTADED
ncbi:MAG TPA: hypothetical protein LFV66_01655 [Rickettsia endosymbiont of Bembidion lapponicum]|nr:hypothetical protein [Rickettsia endosymbiont of Bembidion lapponicum]